MKKNSFPEIFDLNDELALVTGGGTGIGLAISKCLVAAGAKVIIVGRKKDVLEKARKEIGKNCRSIPCDITDMRSIPDLVAQIENEIGHLTILVNNAGNHVKETALNTPDKDFSKIMDVHLSAPSDTGA